MSNAFETRVDRRDRGNLKALAFTPAHIREAGYVSFAGAEFEFPTAPAVIEAVQAAAGNGLFGYTVADAPYFDAVRWWLARVRQAEVPADWICPVQGTIFAVATAIRLLTRPGESVAVFTPGYNRYEQAAARLGRGIVRVPLDGAGQPDLAALAAALERPDCRLLVFSNPNNPTGQLIPAGTLREILRLARRRGAAVVSDEIFADVVWAGGPTPLLAALAEEGDAALSLISLGKTFSLTGVNHADALIRNPVLRARFLRQRDADHFGSIDPLAYAALRGGYSPAGLRWLEELKTVIWRNDQRFLDFFAAHLPSARALRPMGTYVLWADLSGLGLADEALHRFLREEAYFCCDPGQEFYGGPGTVRICTAVPPGELEKSLAVLAAALERRFGKEREQS